MSLEVLTVLIIKSTFLGAKRHCSLAHTFKGWGGILYNCEVGGGRFL
jgi:hypothetical protein